MRHLDLFTGIGGFRYAAEQVWQGEYENIACCEIDKFCQKIIQQHWPTTRMVDDVRDDELKLFRNVDLLTAGIPCQPASVAGKKRGVNDQRWLWPETFAVIGAVRPRWALLENVPGLFTLDCGEAFNGIISGLAEIGYGLWWEVVPACSVGACHRRDRIWILAYSIDGCDRGERGQTGKENCIPQVNRQTLCTRMPCRTNQNVADSYVGQSESRIITKPDGQTQLECSANDSSGRNAGNTIGSGCCRDTRWRPEQEPANRYIQTQSFTDSEIIGLQRGIEADGCQGKKSYDQLADGCGGKWNEHWIAAATRFCTLDDGLSGRMAKPKGWRANALKAGGNAIVPQIAMIYFTLIKHLGRILEVEAKTISAGSTRLRN